MKKRLIFLIVGGLFLGSLFAQGQGKSFYKLPVYGKYFETTEQFHRVDTVKYGDMPTGVKKLYTNSAGLFVTFRSNSPQLYAKWCTTDKKVGLNLTAIANKGLDVYIRNGKGMWQYAGSKGTINSCEESLILEDLDNTDKEFLIYLPLYDETKSLEIGVQNGSSFAPLSNPFKGNIVVYGSSIVHGASASRPGMAYPAILSRRTGFNFLNFGVSGSAKMEKGVVHMLGDTNPDLFILDCVPNSSPEQVTERTSYLVSYLRDKHPNTPIIMIPSVVRELSHFNQSWGKRNTQQNDNWKAEYDKLLAKGMKSLYYLDTDRLLGDDHEATTDGTHPSDLGFMRMVAEIEPFVLDVIKKHQIN
ncbi:MULTISPECIES: SGNH/GDSL hydrolase family protein [Sphingobacterium]|uniref:SGNH/GDSL hydrolase family protein n=1 Tax=Sphingobacterium TaxID=28453 RepID=UPI0013DD5FD2|nr:MULTISPECIES: SGNH/GDSL hydrolase family protein [unclassified Sphingobacterium]